MTNEEEFELCVPILQKLYDYFHKLCDEEYFTSSDDLADKARKREQLLCSFCYLVFSDYTNSQRRKQGAEFFANSFLNAIYEKIDECNFDNGWISVNDGLPSDKLPKAVICENEFVLISTFINGDWRNLPKYSDGKPLTVYKWYDLPMPAQEN